MPLTSNATIHLVPEILVNQTAIPRPATDEYAPFYSGYVATVAEGDVRAVLERQTDEIRSMCAALSDSDALFRYAPGKWSIKEVVGHICDSERIFAYRALRIMRGDKTPLAGFDQNAYVAAADFDSRSLEELLQEMDWVRASTLALLRSVEPNAWERRGIASSAEVSLRALVYIIAGHTQHHLQILTDRYRLDPSRVEEPGDA